MRRSFIPFLVLALTLGLPAGLFSTADCNRNINRICHLNRMMSDSFDRREEIRNQTVVCAESHKEREAQVAYSGNLYFLFVLILRSSIHILAYPVQSCPNPVTHSLTQSMSKLSSFSPILEVD